LRTIFAILGARAGFDGYQTRQLDRALLVPFAVHDLRAMDKFNEGRLENLQNFIDTPVVTRFNRPAIGAVLGFVIAVI
jgi:hypothetical protein